MPTILIATIKTGGSGDYPHSKEGTIMILFHDFAFSAQGYNHIKENKVCQDFSGSFSDGNGVYIAVVADGHGSDNYPRTDKGARYAVESALTAVRQFVAAAADGNINVIAAYESHMQQLAKNILSLWHGAVEKDVAGHPFMTDELLEVAERYKNKYLFGGSNEKAKAYGATLIMVCVTPAYWFGLQIGDGRCVAFSCPGDVTEPIPWDEDCQANVTTSICDSDAIHEFRSYCSSDLPLAVFIGSDGVDDSYTSSEELYALYRSMLIIFAQHGEKVGLGEIEKFLPILSKKGSGDDVSIAGFVGNHISHDTLDLIKAKDAYATAQMVYKKAKKNVVAAEERLGYIVGTIKKARITYEIAEQKEADAKIELEKANSALKNAAEKLQASEIQLDTLLGNLDKSDESEEKTTNFPNIHPQD